MFGATPILNRRTCAFTPRAFSLLVNQIGSKGNGNSLMDPADRLVALRVKTAFIQRIKGMNANELLDLARNDFKNPQEVSLDVWSAFASRVVNVVSSLSAEHLTVVSYTLYRAGIAHPELWETLTHEMTNKLPQFSNEALSLCLHVLGDMKLPFLSKENSSDAFLVALRRQLHRKDVALNPVVVTSLIFAYSENRIKAPNFYKFLAYSVRATAVPSEAAAARLERLGVSGGDNLVVDSDIFDNEDFLTCALGLLRAGADLGDLGGILDATLAYRIAEQGLLESLDGQSGAVEVLALLAASPAPPTATLAAIWEQRELLLKDEVVEAARLETGRHLHDISSRTACDMLHAAGLIFQSMLSTSPSSPGRRVAAPGTSQILETDSVEEIFAEAGSSRGTIISPGKQGDAEALSIHSRRAMGLAEWAAVHLQESQAVPAMGDAAIVAALEGASLINGGSLGQGGECVNELLGAAKFLSAEFSLGLLARTLVSVSRVRGRRDAVVNETLLRQLENKLEIAFAPSKKRKAGRQVGEVCDMMGRGKCAEVVKALHDLDLRASPVLKVRLQELVAEEQRKATALEQAERQRKQREAARLAELETRDIRAAFGDDVFEKQVNSEKQAAYLEVSEKQRRMLSALSSLGDREDTFLPDALPTSEEEEMPRLVDLAGGERNNLQSAPFGEIPVSVSERSERHRIDTLLGHLTAPSQTLLRAAATGTFSTDDHIGQSSPSARKPRVSTRAKSLDEEELVGSVGEPKFDSKQQKSEEEERKAAKRATIAERLERHREKQMKKDQALQKIKDREKRRKEREQLGLPEGVSASRHAYLTRHAGDKPADRERMEKIFGNSAANVRF